MAKRGGDDPKGYDYWRTAPNGIVGADTDSLETKYSVTQEEDGGILIEPDHTGQSSSPISPFVQRKLCRGCNKHPVVFAYT